MVFSVTLHSSAILTFACLEVDLCIGVLCENYWKKQYLPQQKKILRVPHCVVSLSLFHSKHHANCVSDFQAKTTTNNASIRRLTASLVIVDVIRLARRYKRTHPVQIPRRARAASLHVSTTRHFVTLCDTSIMVA